MTIGTGGEDVNEYPSPLHPAVIFFIPIISFGILKLLNPIVLYYSRKMERDCDDYALKLASKPKALISSLQKLADDNLVEYYPPAWHLYLFADHPPIGERIERAREFMEAINYGDPL